MFRFLFTLLLLAVLSRNSSVDSARADAEASRAKAMASAAVSWLDSLTAARRQLAALPFGHAARRGWQATPGPRVGLAWGSMTKVQRALAESLMRTGLSPAGMRRFQGVKRLEGILRRRQGWRNPGLYWLAVYGDPSKAKAWSWRIEGHHYSRQFTCVAGSMSVSPSFHGANPAQAGASDQGLRVLASEEDVARELMLSLDEGRRARALLSSTARDFLPAAPRRLSTIRRRGLRAADMTDAQRAILWRLVRVWTESLHPELAAKEVARARATQRGEIRFGWMGGTKKGASHGYRVHGPTLLLEFWQGGNHIHTVWRDPLNEFGAASLASAEASAR